MPGAYERPQHLFVVRVWQEQSRLLPDQWRGSVEHVASGQRLYFASLGDLTNFIAFRINGTATDEPANTKGERL